MHRAQVLGPPLHFLLVNHTNFPESFHDIRSPPHMANTVGKSHKQRQDLLRATGEHARSCRLLAGTYVP